MEQVVGSVGNIVLAVPEIENVHLVRSEKNADLSAAGRSLVGEADDH